jgi:hypothetical protein
MKRKYTLVILGLCICCLSCKKKSKQDVEPITPDIYLAGGSMAANGHYNAQYWKNDSVVEMYTVNYILGGGYIALSGADIHVAHQSFPIGEAYGKYWKNGVVTTSPKNKVPEWISGLKVFGQNVYILGSYEGSGQATYWKNGEAISYTDGVNGDAQGIFVTGNDVYITGSVEINGKRVACYWKNGNRITLGPDTENSYGLRIAVKDNDVHVVGVKGLTRSGRDLYATYWKNGVEIPLTDHSEDYSFAQDIAISGSDVYIIGDVTKGITRDAKIWKNGQASTLPSGNMTSGIFAYDGDIYVAGSGEGGFDGGRAMYWKNGNPTFLSDGKTSVWVSSIFVHKP